MPTLGDKTFNDLGIIYLRGSQRPISPETRDHTLQIGGRHGAWDFGADLGPKRFELSCGLIESNDAALQTAIDNLNAHLFDATGRPKTMKLIFDDSPEKYYMVRIVGGIQIERIVGTGRFTLPLVAFDPFKRAPSTAYDPVETYLYDTGLQYDSGLMYDNPEEFYWRYRRQRIGLYNYSDQNTPVRIVVRGSVINPRITNETTGTRLTIGSYVTEKMEADTKLYFVRQSQIQTDTHFLSTTFPVTNETIISEDYLISEQYGDFAYLAPGKNSLLLEGGIPDATVNVLWEHKFL